MHAPTADEVTGMPSAGGNRITKMAPRELGFEHLRDDVMAVLQAFRGNVPELWQHATPHRAASKNQINGLGVLHGRARTDKHLFGQRAFKGGIYGGTPHFNTRKPQ